MAKSLQDCKASIYIEGMESKLNLAGDGKFGNNACNILFDILSITPINILHGYKINKEFGDYIRRRKEWVKSTSAKRWNRKAGKKWKK